MEDTGMVFGKIAFYVALAALVVILVIKKRKQVRGSQKNEDENDINRKNNLK